MSGFDGGFHQQPVNPSMDAGGQISAEQLRARTTTHCCRISS